MRIRMMAWIGLAAAGVVWPQLSSAQTIQERITILEEKITERVETLPVDIHALIATDYQYSFNRPGTHDVQLHVFDLSAPSFIVNDVALFVTRQREDESWGFMIDFDFGTVSQAVNGVDNQAVPSLREAYLTYKLPWELPTTKAPVTLKAGKFVTLLGYEIIKTWTNFNPNIANSISFGFGIPFTHVGALANIPALEWLTFDLGIVNGWDVQIDNNSSLTFLGGMGIAPVDMFSMYISGTYGPEQSDHSGASNRGVFSANATLKPTDFLTFAIDGTFGNDTNVPLPAKGGVGGDRSGCVTPGVCGTGEWYGLVGYVIWQATDKLQLILRPEVFDDGEGVRTGAGYTGPTFGGSDNPNAAKGAGTVWAITPTIAYQLTDHILARAEYRYDHASRRYFDFGDGGNVRRTNNVLLMEALVAF